MAEQSVFQKIAGYVGTYAPGIAAILMATGVGAPAAGAVAAMGALAKSLGLPEDTKPETVLSTIQSMPESELKLSFIQADNDFKLRELEMRLRDVQSARNREVETTKVTGKGDYNLYALSWVVILGFLGVVIILLFVDVPADQTNVLYALLGTLGAGFMLVLQYFYGSNKSSETKTDMIYNSTPNVPKKEV